MALYGHPNAGAYWEEHCREQVLKGGFTPIEDWPSCYWHPEHKTFLIVYVDDFKMSGPAEGLS